MVSLQGFFGLFQGSFYVQKLSVYLKSLAAFEIAKS